jgi:acyl dehydratase
MLSEAILILIGKPFKKITFNIEKESVRRFADAVGDSNPLYFDVEYAAKSGYGSIIAPPGYISSPWYWANNKNNAKSDEELNGLMDMILALAKAGYNQTIDSSIDYDFFQPVKVGDTITALSFVRDIAERGKGTEKAVFLFLEITYTNQNNETVAVVRMTTTHR